MKKTTLLSRAQGALLGQLVGDALGSAVQGWTPERIRDSFPGGVYEMTGNAELGTIPGQLTDDSEMALALARTLAEHGEYQEAAAREEYLKWYRSGAFGYGPVIADALENSASPDDTGNGALMRVSPLGIFGSRVWAGVVELWAREDCMITHAHPVCIAANELYAVAIATAIRVPAPREVLFEHLRAHADADAVLADSVARARSDPPDYLARPDSVVVSLHNALWQLMHAHSFEEALVDTISRGGCTGTNAAVCGALLGAALGSGAIPERWVKAVLSCTPGPGVARPRPREYWPVDALELAEKLIADHPAPVAGVD